MLLAEIHLSLNRIAFCKLMRRTYGIYGTTSSTGTKRARQIQRVMYVTSFLPHSSLFSLDQNYLVETEDDSRTGKVIFQFQLSLITLPTRNSKILLQPGKHYFFVKVPFTILKGTVAREFLVPVFCIKLFL